MSENGFQIFKPNKPEDASADENSIENIAASLSDHADDQINKTVDPVPMGSDAIEEALKLIEDQPADDESTDEKEPDIGFIPANINGSVFGSTSPSSEDDQAEDDTPIPQDDDQIISDLLNEDGPVISSMPSHDEGQKKQYHLFIWLKQLQHRLKPVMMMFRQKIKFKTGKLGRPLLHPSVILSKMKLI